jgi:methylmalonyl-CoA mutase N-terminal domain/subunit
MGVPELQDVEIVLNGVDLAVLMVSSCQSIVLGLTTLVAILKKRNIPDTDLEYQKFRSDLAEYIQRLELALRIQDKIREMVGLVETPVERYDVGYG